MKKIIAIVMMVLLLSASVYIAEDIKTDIADSYQEVAANEEKERANPMSVNLNNLQMYGIEPFVSKVPVVMVDTGNQQIKKEEPVSCDVAIIDKADKKNDILGNITAFQKGSIKYRGASSYSSFDKPQYRLKLFQQENDKALDYAFLGMAPHSEWVLNGPYLDRSLLRNYLMYNLSREIMEWAPDCRYMELFVDGAYKGIYLAVEPVTNGGSRLGLSEFGLLSGATAYIVKRDRVGTEENVIRTYGEKSGYTGQELSIAYPGSNELTLQQKYMIEDNISEFEKRLYSDDFDDAVLGYRQYIDMDSFVDYYILNEFAMNHDAGILSTYVYKDLEGLIKLSVWDFNNGFNNYQWFEMSTERFYINENYWFDRLMQDRNFAEKVEERYRELRKGPLSESHIYEKIREGQNLLGDAINRNFAVWGYTFDTKLLVSEGDVSRDPKSYTEAVTQLMKIISARLKFMDENIASLQETCIN